MCSCTNRGNMRNSKSCSHSNFQHWMCNNKHERYSSICSLKIQLDANILNIGKEQCKMKWIWKRSIKIVQTKYVDIKWQKSNRSNRSKNLVQPFVIIIWVCRNIHINKLWECMHPSFFDSTGKFNYRFVVVFSWKKKVKNEKTHTNHLNYWTEWVDSVFICKQLKWIWFEHRIRLAYKNVLLHQHHTSCIKLCHVYVPICWLPNECLVVYRNMILW